MSTQVLERLAPCLQPDEMFRALPAVLMELVPHDAGLLATVGAPAAGQLKLRHAYGFNGAGHDLPEELTLSRLVDPWPLDTGPLHVPDLGASSVQVADLFTHGGMRSLLGIRVGVSEADDIEAVLILAHRQPAAFAGISDDILAHFQRVVAIPLRNVLHLAAQEQRSEELLAQAGRLWEIVTATTSPRPGLAHLLDTALEIAGADAGTIMVVVPESAELYVRASRGMRTRATADMQLPWGTRDTTPLRDLPAHLWIPALVVPGQPPRIPGAPAEGLQTYLGLPWRSAGGPNIVGLLNLYWRRPVPELAPPQMAVLDSLGHAGAVLLEQTELREFSANCDRILTQFQAHKAQTLSLMSHQLRTPITAISGFAQLLLRRAPDPAGPVSRYAQTIQSECKRLNTLVDNVLELSRLEGSLVATHSRAFDVLALLRDLASESPVCEQIAAGVLSWALPDQLPVAVADPLHLKQALLVLLREDPHAPAGPGPRRFAARSRSLAGRLRVELTIETADAVPLGASVDELLVALDLQQAIDRQQARETELPLYAALQYLRAMGAEARKDRAAGDQARYVVTLPGLAET